MTQHRGDSPPAGLAYDSVSAGPNLVSVNATGPYIDIPSDDDNILNILEHSANTGVGINGSMAYFVTFDGYDSCAPVGSMGRLGRLSPPPFPPHSPCKFCADVCDNRRAVNLSTSSCVSHTHAHAHAPPRTRPLSHAPTTLRRSGTPFAVRMPTRSHTFSKTIWACRLRSEWTRAAARLCLWQAKPMVGSSPTRALRRDLSSAVFSSRAWHSKRRP